MLKFITSLTRGLLILMALNTNSIFANSSDEPGGDEPMPEETPSIKMGKWLGYLKLPETEKVLALSLDTYIVQPTEFRDFPKLNAIVKINLGGFGSNEYETEVFSHIQYSFETKEFTLTEEENDLALTFMLKSTPSLQLEGKVSIRSLSMEGEFNVVFQSSDDEPEDLLRRTTRNAGLSYVSTLSGQYIGKCGSYKALLQLQTARDLDEEKEVESAGSLLHYTILGKLGLDDPSLCLEVNSSSVSTPHWCLYKNYSSGSYNIYDGSLILNGERNSMECSKSGEGALNCQTAIMNRNETCELRKVERIIEKKNLFKKQSQITLKESETRPLSDLTSDKKKLQTEIQGSYYGYLHHETRDIYQPLLFKTLSYVSTDNPHNLDNVFFSSSLFLYLGDQVSKEFVPQSYDARIFDPNPGMTISNAQTDSFLQITEWRTGFIAGILFSKSFGRVGTFELVKRESLPQIDKKTIFISSIQGSFKGENPSALNDASMWRYRIVVPIQPRFSNGSALRFQGEFRLQNSRTTLPWQKIKKGSYDFYTGSLNWLTDETSFSPRLISGNAPSLGKMQLFWPSANRWGSKMFDVDFQSFVRE